MINTKTGSEEEARMEMERMGGSNLRKYVDRSANGTEDRMYLCDTWVGKCLFDYEYNGYDDSDFYMTVWNSEKKAPESLCFASTRGWSYPCYGSWADATPEVIAEYREWLKRTGVESIRSSDIQKAQTVEKGKLIRVVRGRKIAKGTVGYCFWVGRTNFGVSVGIQHEDGFREFTALKNVEVAGWEAYLPENWEESIERRAEYFANGSLANGRAVGA